MRTMATDAIVGGILTTRDKDGKRTPLYVNLKTHEEDQCSGENCVVHNPSDHHMVTWPTMWRADKQQMERLCVHGIGHPDPDDLSHHERHGNYSMAIHGCDGCCE